MTKNKVTPTILFVNGEMKKRAKKQGRPPVDEPMIAKTIRCRPSQWKRWQTAAEASGKTPSEWLREVADAAAKKANE